MSKNVPTFDIAMIYEQLSKTKAKELKGLANKKIRDQKDLFLVEGDKCVKDSVSAFEPVHIIATDAWLKENSDFILPFKEYVLQSDSRGIEIISSFNSLPQVIAVLKKPEENKKIPVLEKDKLYLLLDDIQDPGNMGTIIRTCDWFGVYDIFASKNTVDIYGPKVVQSAMGSLSRVKVTYLDLAELIQRNPDIRVIGTLLEGKPFNVCGNLNSGMLIMGNEGNGISQKLKGKITLPVTIPPFNNKNHPDSLNVAIATAVILSYIRNQ